MILRRFAIGSLLLGTALVLLGLVSQQRALKLLTSDQVAKEMGQAEIAYHEATAMPNSSSHVETARTRLLKARDKVVQNREHGNAVSWWSRTAGFVLVILGGILWMAAASGEK